MKIEDNVTKQEDEGASDHIQWSNVIFLPFHPIFKLIVTSCVILKCVLGPLQAVYPYILCTDLMDQNLYLSHVKYIYVYFTDAIYGIDTFLHIVHRQVTEEAMKREHMPKSAFLLIVDLISLIPFFRLLCTESCPPSQFYPNIFAFSETIILYRVVQHFKWSITHSLVMLLVCFVVISVLVINCLTCLFLLLTIHGLCPNCQTGLYDWRSYVFYRFNETDYDDFSTYIYGTSFTLSFLVNKLIDELKPNTQSELIIIVAIMLIGYILNIFELVPKMFAEAVLHIRRIYTFHERVSRIIDETRRRNPSPKAYKSVENFYSLIWKKRKGITATPELISELPRYLRLDIRQDLVWPVFHHSPTFRKTSQSYKRWLCDYIHLTYKLPGERLYVGPHCYTNLYYVKSGIVQLISSDDSTSPLLSVSGGTIFGDVSFAIPPFNRRVIVRCLTYCEVFCISRSDILKSLHKFPEDRRLVMKLTNERMKHARTLFECKQNVRGLHRSEDEGIAWLKKRWWEISDVLTHWKSTKKERQRCELPPEESSYHCAKFIGQLVLCTSVQLQRKSMFANVEFPWILLPQSTFGRIWTKIVIFTVYLVLLLYPPNLTREMPPKLFLVFQYYVDLVYIVDIVVSLMTGIDNRGDVSISFATVLFSRFKSLYFILDILATIWIEKLMILIGMPEMYEISQFNRLIKVYILFSNKFNTEWKKKKEPIQHLFFQLALIHFCFIYVLAYFFFLIEEKSPKMSLDYFFGPGICSQKDRTSTFCTSDIKHLFEVAIAWMFEFTYSGYVPLSFIDVGIGLAISFLTYILFIYTGTKCLASLYLKYRDMANYRYVVSNLKKHYNLYKIHPDLLKRLHRFMVCHWKYFHGMDIMQPNSLKCEPYDIYWKLHGETAEKVIGESSAFVGANPCLIRDLAHKAKFLIIPKNSTLFLFGAKCKNVTWIVNGYVICEHHNETGELLKTHAPPGEMLALSSVFLGKASLKTYLAVTDCEVLYIKESEFFTIIKNYPNDWTFFETCVDEVSPVFEQMFLNYVKKHRDYQRKLREQILHSQRSVAVQAGKICVKKMGSKTKLTRIRNICTEIKTIPESRFVAAIIIFLSILIDGGKIISLTLTWIVFHPKDYLQCKMILVTMLLYTNVMQVWLLFRAIVVVISIMSTALQGGSGAVARWPLVIITAFCDFVCLIDIILKLFLAYYDKRGLVISNLRKCMLHYGTRGLILDIIGVLPWHVIYLGLLKTDAPDQNEALLLDTISRFAHVYLVNGYFDYISDSPTVNYAFLMILKWQVFIFLLMMGTSHYFVSNCIYFKWDDNYQLVSMRKYESCWLPAYLKVSSKPTVHQLHLMFAESLSFAQCGLNRVNLGKFLVHRNQTGIAVILVFLGVLFWYLMCMCQTLLVLTYRGNTLFQHGVHKLSSFLKAERVDKALIDRAETHFTYWWIRTKGLQIQNFINERLGVVFRQDLSYYFFKKTFLSLDTILRGGEALGRQLAGILTQVYSLPGEDIMREMDLIPYVYVVHRGRVSISQHGKKLAILTKGSIFGQLEGSKVRPIHITAKAEEHTDLLEIHIKQFQETINDDVREKIAHNRQAENDYMSLKRPVAENPFNTIKYILRGRKTIWLPWMSKPVEAHFMNWYSRWLFCVWLVGPVVAAILVLTQKTLPTVFKGNLTWCLVLLDLLHFAHFATDFYSTHLAVHENQCVHQYRRLHKLAELDFYSDLTSLFMPLLTPITGNWNYQLTRLFRLHGIYDFNKHFCQNFESKTMPVLVKFLMVLLLLHALTCGWMVIACRREKGEPFPVRMFGIPASINRTLDYDEWVSIDKRINGCPRISKSYRVDKKKRYGFIVPKNWQADYILALTYIVVLHTHTNLDLIVPLSIQQVYFKIVMNAILCLVEMWLSSVTISAIYTKLRDLYMYDYHVANLITYLKYNGLTSHLLQAVTKYTNQLWERQRGYWLPEITQQAPICLREDMFSALYMHHLETPSLFHQLPPYFLRQLVAKLKRVVIFPGNSIVREGDIFPCIYFIHEGEIEKWFNSASGERKLVSLLGTNGYFGMIPCLFPDTPFQFTYYARTVVDLVYLKNKDWQELLDGYPEVRFNLYSAALKLKHSLRR